MAEEKLEGKGIPEAVLVKQKILGYQFEAIRYKANSRFITNIISMLSDKDQNKKFHENQRFISRKQFESALLSLYDSLKVYDWEKDEIDFFKKFDDAIKEEKPLDWGYLLDAFDKLNEIIKRLGISDFQIYVTPPEKAFLETGYGQFNR